MEAYISDTSDTDSFELAAIKLLYSSLEVCSSLKLDKASIIVISQSPLQKARTSYPLPSRSRPVSE